jgi:hypothetical protein
MSDDTPAEKKARRWRWITFGEVVGVAAVVVSGLSFWDSRRDRERTEQEKAVVEQRQTAVAMTLALGAAAEAEGTRLKLAPLRDDQAVQGQTIRFPSALGIAAVETTGDARIEREWFDDALRKARKAAGREAKSAGDERMPVWITTRYVVGSEVHTDNAFYDVGYATTAGGLFDAGDVLLKGLAFIARAPKSGAPERLDALWKARLPAK